MSLVFCCYLLLLCIFFMEGYYYCYYNTVDCTVCFISCRSCSKEPAYLLFQIFQIFSLHLKFSNLLFEIFKSSLSDHCIIIFRRHTTVGVKENSLTPTVDSLAAKKILCNYAMDKIFSLKFSNRDSIQFTSKSNRACLRTPLKQTRGQKIYYP